MQRTMRQLRPRVLGVIAAHVCSALSLFRPEFSGENEHAHAITEACSPTWELEKLLSMAGGLAVAAESHPSCMDASMSVPTGPSILQSTPVAGSMAGHAQLPMTDHAAAIAWHWNAFRNACL